MCHFHSVIVDGAGRIYHLQSNSHSAIAAHFNLYNAELNSPFWECEWDGIGAQPVNLCQQRGSMKVEPTSAAVRAADQHYAKLATIIKGDYLPGDVYPFNLPEYSDVPEQLVRVREMSVIRAEQEKAQAKRKAERKIAEDLGAMIFSVFGEKLEALPDDAMVIAIRQFVELSSVTMEETAADEIESATDDMISTDDAYSYVLDGGGYISQDELDDYVKDSDDYYTQDQLDDAISDAKCEWIKAAQEAIENVG